MYASSTLGSIASQIAIGIVTAGVLSLCTYSWRHRGSIVDQLHSERLRSFSLIGLGVMVTAMLLLGLAVGSLEGSIADDGAGTSTTIPGSSSTPAAPHLTSTTAPTSTTTAPPDPSSTAMATTTDRPMTTRTSVAATTPATSVSKPTTTVAATPTPSVIRVNSVSYSTALGTCSADGTRTFTVVETFHLGLPHPAGSLNAWARAVTTLVPPPMPWSKSMPITAADGDVTHKVQFAIEAGDELELAYATTPEGGPRSATAAATVRPDAFPAC